MKYLNYLFLLTTVQLNSATFNVKDYGAAGTGAVNDYPAYASAYAAANLNDTIYFPAGSYRLDTFLTLNSNIVIIGAGINLTKLLFTNCAPNYAYIRAVAPSAIIVDSSNITFAWTNSITISNNLFCSTNVDTNYTGGIYTNIFSGILISSNGFAGLKWYSPP